MQVEVEVLTSALKVTNTRPLLIRMQRLLEEANCTNPGSMAVGLLMRYDACLWALIAQRYGELAKVDMYDEYERLRRVFVSHDMLPADASKPAVLEG